jgi:acyl-CoA synthetase (AMP-forming)/AMP-acid ligase II
LRDDSGREVEKLEEMGEIEIASPSVLRGYIHNANDAILPPAGDEDFWWPTGDVGLFRVAPSGETHLFVVDRIRDMIKVKVNESTKMKRKPTHSEFMLSNYFVGQPSRSRPD